MGNCGKDILLTREGTEQGQRYIDALNPDNVKLNDFTLENWMEFAYNFASHVNYFSTENDLVPDGNWQDFFKSKTEIENFLKELEAGTKITPHLALFVAFVQLLELSKSRFNGLTKRHLDFYYGSVLKMEKQAAQPDKVHVLFELAKNAVSEKIAKETQLDGGKDADGKKVVYKTTDEIVANQTKVGQLKSVYNDHDNAKLKAAEVANSYDGKGAGFPDGEIKWWPFGYYESDEKNKGKQYPELADAKVGFAVAGEILELAEGERTVQLKIGFANKLEQAISFDDLHENIEIYCSGEKAWLGPFSVSNSSDFPSGLSVGLKELKIAFQIPTSEKALVGYKQKVHEENFTTKHPVCRILLKTGNSKGHELYRNMLAQNIVKIDLSVNVKNAKQLQLQNDNSVLNATKTFSPFGNQPAEKSKFYIAYPEVFKKKWKEISIRIDWKNVPDNLKDWYFAYRKSFLNELTPKNYVSGINNSANSNLIVKNEASFTAEIESDIKGNWEILTDEVVQLFSRNSEKCYAEFKISEDLFDEEISSIRLSLNQSFLHKMFPQLYALALSSQNENAILPNEPYTPLAETISLNYRATASIEMAANAYISKDFQLFHEHPFGQSEECLHLKKENAALKDDADIELNLVPEYCKGGELYIGLENAQAQQMISLLFQVLEGSENPDVASFSANQKIEWSVLCANEWMTLNSTAIVQNDTDNLLKSGILKFTIPKEATSNNTLLPAGYFWLQAKMYKSFDAVSKCIGVHAQAVVAELSRESNSQQYLTTGLESNTISKMLNRTAQVKQVSQPYNSFGGSPEELDAAYYRRVSERLRHKNRAITVWDYERLVLQNFPEIHKVKCLSHSCSKVVNEKRLTKYLSPGKVVIVVIPDIVNKNVFDIYQPRVRKATLNNIEDFLQKRNSKLVQTIVVNPQYEELRINLKAKFRKGFDEAHYKSVLKQDLTRLLSPWAFDRTSSIKFGISLHKSVLINYAEQLAYVDFVSDVKMYQKNAESGEETEVQVAVPTKPEAILVSSKEHAVNDAQNNCLDMDTEAEETCQK
ncbi:hypothetical protein [uncultured Draconibacterium sp.]|uniref:hypothetical protein n=1 Tax=uncultured Draconibacterium sp. TaxID=1573823 RepID=UPI003217070D